MNEQISRLLSRAEYITAEEHTPGSLGYIHGVFACFAELIVQECIDAAGEPADGLIKGDTWHDGVRASCQSIKQHFGVE